MRPQSIQMFEKLYLVSLIIGVLNFVVFFGDSMALLESELGGDTSGLGSGVMIGSFVVGMVISLTLWYFIARKGSNIAKWIFVVLTIWGLVGIPTALTMMDSPQMIVTLAITAMQLVALFFLFRPDAKAWFSKEPPADPSVFE